MPAAVPGAGTGCSEPGLVRKEINRKFIKIRRGRRRQKNVKRLYSSDLNILHCNIRGYDSKQVSLQSILSASKPNLVILNETHYQGNKEIKIKGYDTFCKNRQSSAGGGIATAVLKKDFKHALKIGEGTGSDEFLITRHSQFKVPINVINIYG